MKGDSPFLFSIIYFLIKKEIHNSTKVPDKVLALFHKNIVLKS